MTAKRDALRLPGFGVMTAATILEAGKVILFLPLLTRSLSVAGYGLWSLSGVSVSILLPIATLQLYGALPHRFATDEERSSGIRTAGLAIAVWSVGIGALLWAASGSVAELLDVPALARPLRYGSSLWLPLAALTTFEHEALRLLGAYRRFGLFLAFKSLGELLGAAIALRLHAGVLEVIWGVAAADAAALLLGARLIGVRLPRHRPSWPILRQQLTLAIPLVPGALSYWVINSSDRFFLGRFESASEVGIYAAAYALGALLVWISYPFLNILLPSATRRWHLGDQQGASATFALAVKAYLAVGIPSVVGLGLLARDVLTRVASSDYAGGAGLVALIATGQLIFQSGTAATYVFQLAGRTVPLLPVLVGGAVLNLALNFALVPPWGARGAAVATLITFALSGGIVLLLSRRYLKFRVSFLDVVRALAASGVMAAVIVPLGGSATLPSIVGRAGIGVAVYALAALVLGLVRRDEWLILKSHISLRRAH